MSNLTVLIAALDAIVNDINEVVNEAAKAGVPPMLMVSILDQAKFGIQSRIAESQKPKIIPSSRGLMPDH
jgi:hypothetical protein